MTESDRTAARRRRAGWICLWAATGCLGVEPKPPPADPAPEVLGLVPEMDVPTGAAVTVQLSRAVEVTTDRWPVTVRRPDGRHVDVDAGLTEDGMGLVLTPGVAWPRAETLEVILSAGLETATGVALRLPEAPLTFTTREEPTPEPSVVVRAPPSGRPAPVNLRWVVLGTSAPVPDRVESVDLVSDGGVVTAAVTARSEARLLVELPAYEGPCQPLCPDQTYRPEMAHGAFLAADGPAGRVRTSSAVDDLAPTVTATRVMVAGDRVMLDVDATEPVLVLGVLEAPDGTRIPLAPPRRAARQVRVEPGERLVTDTEYRARLEVVDLAGRAAPPVEVSFRTPVAPRIRISELVTTPLRDWSDSEGGEVPFDPHPGVGAVNANDEWIELVNEGEDVLDVRDAALELRALDGSPAVTILYGAPALYFGDGGDKRHWWPGEALVVRPRGALSQRGLRVELWAGALLVDAVVLGDAADADHPGGGPPDARREAIARDVAGRWRWCRPTPGDPVPSADCE